MTQPTPTPIDLSLLGDGIGIAAFGDPTDAVIEKVSGILGAADDDTGFVDHQVIGFCGEGQQRSVSWGDLHLGFVNHEHAGYSGFIAYSMSARHFVDGVFVTDEDPSPLVRLPHGITVLDTETEARIEFGEALSPIADHPLGGGRLAVLDLGGPWHVTLLFDEDHVDRITRIESSPCGE